MPPEHARTFGGGLTETSLNPFVLVAMIIAAVLILTLPRKHAIIPLLCIAFLIPLPNAVVVGSVHFFVSRIIILVGLIRVVMVKSTPRERMLAGGFNPIDRAFFWCMIFQAVAAIILFADTSALINQFGFLIDFVGAYFLLRSLIRDDDDIHRVLKCLALITAVMAVSMIVEQTKLSNTFSLLGGVPATPEIREGKIRSQGVFQHALLAGAFAATLLPLFLMLWKTTKAKLSATIGIIGATVMTLTANSSTPLLAYVAGILGICLWPIRKKMHIVRRGIVLTLLVLSVVMKAPVWFIIAHVDLTGSSSGYHRAALVDQFIRHFSDWWLIGVKDTGSWGWDMWDAQNQYVSVGETGGLAAFILFMAIISRSFRRIGVARKSVAGDSKQEWRMWFLGVAMFSHLVAFFGVNYFDQSRMGWLILLAMICTVSAPALRPVPVQTEVTVNSDAVCMS
jgi:hypothetical protein